jgi:predicted MFS family arabinose efflux permease
MEGDTDASDKPVARAPVLQLLVEPDFQRLWVAGALAGTMRWLDTLAVGVYVLQVTGSALIVALTLFLRTVPMFLFGVVAGAITEKIDRRVLLLSIVGTLAVTYAVLTWLTLTGRLELWQLSLGVFITGIYWALELPTRRTMVADIAGMDRIGPAMSLESMTNNITRMLGPLAGGILFELFGMVGTQALGAFLYGAAFVLIAMTADRKTPRPTQGRAISSDIAEGLRFAWGHRTVLATLTITVACNVFGFSYISMVPVIAHDVLGVSAFPTGLLMSAEGFGAVVGAMAIAFLATPARFTRIYTGGAALFLACIVVFSQSTEFAFSLPLLCVSGVGMACFGAMQSTLIVSSSPPEMRNRMMGVLAMCIGMQPLGVLLVGFLADQLGPQTGILITGGSGLCIVIACAIAWPEMRKHRA